MKKVFFKTMMGAGLICMLLAGCVESIKDLYDPNYVIQQYQKNWTDSIGQIDPNQTWNMAKRVIAEIDLAGVSAGVSKVDIYTANPLTPSTKLLASVVVSDYGTIEFDMPKPLNYVYVKAQSAPRLNGYYSVRDGIVMVSSGMTRADEVCDVTLGDIVNMKTYYDCDQQISLPLPGTWYLLNNVTKTDATAWRFMDYLPLFGKDGYWAEQRDNYTYYSGQWDLNTDIVLETIEEGTVEITYAFGSTAYRSMFGYFYFEDGATTEEILQGKKYILMSDAQPLSNIKVDGFTGNFEYADNNAMGSWFIHNMWEDGTFQGGNPFVTGSTYKLIYFDENGNASYTFPAGLNVGFFLISNGMNEGQLNGDNTYFSMCSLNNATGKKKPQYHGSVGAITYKYGETIMLGFEDNMYSQEYDLNDMVIIAEKNLRYVGGNENLEEFPVETPEVEAQEWILACEDLGTTDDFDFNDVVFSVHYVAGSATAVVAPLAAGGTMPAQICYNGTAIGKEVHGWFGVSTKTMVNTTSRGNAAEAIEIPVADGFTMTENMGGFSIDINNGTVSVAAPEVGTAPQMILVSDANWAWPYERVRITDAYSQFANWSANASQYADWYATPTGKTVDGDYTNSSLGGGSGDEGTGDEGTGDEGTGDEGTGDGGTGDEGTGDEGTGDDDESEIIGDSVVVDLNSVTIVNDQFIIPASYFINASEEVKICVTVNTGNPDQQEMYVQFFVEHDYFYGNNTSNQYMEYTITDKISEMKDFGLGVNCSVSKITSITIMCK